MGWLYLLGGLISGGGIGYLTGWARGHAKGIELRPSRPVARVLDYQALPPSDEHGTHHHICKPGCPFYGNDW